MVEMLFLIFYDYGSFLLLESSNVELYDEIQGYEKRGERSHKCRQLPYISHILYCFSNGN